jgi:glycine/serine hydroxymethyltransferase
VITNKDRLPWDRRDSWDRRSALRIGTTEVARYGMGRAAMMEIAVVIAAVLVERRGSKGLGDRARRAPRAAFLRLQDCFD